MRRPPLLVALGLLLAGCQTDADLRPASYDELAMAPGHWEWLSTGYQSGLRTPGTEGYTRQLTFGPDNRLTLRRSGQPDYDTTYQLDMSTLPQCGAPPARVPTVTYATNEPRLSNSDRRTYQLSQQGGRQLLAITGEAACADAGGFERYFWVAD